MPGVVLPISFIETGRFVDFYPLKQFAPVIHGNPRARAASQWASPPRGKSVAFSSGQHWVRNPVYTKKQKKPNY